MRKSVSIHLTEINELWWRRSEVSERRYAAVKSFQIFQKIEVLANNPVYFGGVSGLEILLFGRLLGFAISEIVYCKNPKSMLSRLREIDIEFEVISISTSQLVIASDRRRLCFQCMPPQSYSWQVFSFRRGFASILVSIEDVVELFKSIVCGLVGCGFYLNPLRAVQHRLYRFFWKTICFLGSKIGIKDAYKRFRYRRLSVEQFLSLNFASDDPLHHCVRGENTALINCDGRLANLFEILAFHAQQENIELQKRKIFWSSPPVKIGSYPPHYDLGIWGSTNSFYFISLVSGFRHCIPPYNQIKGAEDLKTFCLSYFMRQKEMSENEVRSLMDATTIELMNNSIISGRHRMAAMLGHIIKGGKYFSPVVARF